MEKRFQGTYTAIITPFTEHDTIDWAAFEKLVEHQISGRVEGIVFVGTTGESPTLSHQEHEEILRWSVEKVSGRCKVIHGTGSNNTRESMAFAKVAADSGADAHLVINPYYNRPTPEGLYRHFKAIADVVDLPVIMYNILGRTAVNLDTNTLLKLAEHKNIVGVKEASGNISQMMDVIRRTSSDFSVLVGDDALTLPFMACGGDGLISVVSNCLPRTTSSLVRNCLSGKWHEARSSFYNMLDVMNVTMLESNPIPVKAIMAELGYCHAHIRLPLCEPSDQTMREMQKAVTLIHHLEN
jgi:4-hydroxy-tetrahydrodipicolinate synthase